MSQKDRLFHIERELGISFKSSTVDMTALGKIVNYLQSNFPDRANGRAGVSVDVATGGDYYVRIRPPLGGAYISASFARAVGEVGGRFSCGPIASLLNTLNQPKSPQSASGPR